MIKIQPIQSFEDIKDLFRWKNDPTTRKFAIKTHDKISWETHERWIKKNRNNIFILWRGKEKVGTISFNPEVRIIVDKKYRGQGIAFDILKEFVDYGVIDSESIVRIAEGNIASMGLFIKLGFKPVKYQKGYYIFQK